MNKKSIISLMSVVFHLIIICLVMYIFGFKVVINKANYVDRNDFYQTVDSNYIIYGLSSEEEKEYGELEYIDYIYSYYEYEANVEISSNTYKNSIYIYSNSNYDKTPFDSTRLIESIECENKIYIDYYFAHKFNLSLNSQIDIKIESSNMRFNVAGIYKTNYLDDGVHIMLNYNDYSTYFDTIFTKSKTNKSLVHATDTTQFDSYLKENYIPKAFMLTREDFESEIDYQIYLESYNSKNYYNDSNINIFTKTDLESYNNNVSKYLKMSSLIVVLAIIIIDILVAINYNKKLKVISKNTENAKKYIYVHIISLVLSLVLGLIATYIICSNFNSSFVKINTYTSLIYVINIIICYIISVILGCLIKSLSTLKTISSKKEKQIDNK